MTESPELHVTAREVLGKANRRLAAANQVPGVLYGRGREPKAVALDRHEFDLFAANHAATSTLVELYLDDQKTPKHVMIREVQRSAVKGTVLHVDFLEVSMDKPITAVVGLQVVNDPAGVKAGGVLTIALHEVNVEAKPGDLPESIEVDVAELEIGDSIRLGEVTAPAGVAILDDPETIVASVQAPRLEVEEEEVEGEAVEPELVGKPEGGEE